MAEERYLTVINSPAEHDAAVAKSETEPTVISLTNTATPVCKASLPKYKAIAAKYVNRGINFYVMDFNSTTSMMFKFAPNQLPVIVLMYGGRWCRTVMGANMKELDSVVGQLLEQVKKS